MKANKLFIFPVLLFLTACGSFEISVAPLSSPIPTTAATESFPFSTNTPPATALLTEQINSTATLEIPSPTFVVSPVTQVPPSSTTPTEQTIKIFLIALEDNGQSGTLVGCSDSAIPVTVTVPATQGVLKAALEKLLSAKKQFYGESRFYNALYQSDLQVKSVTIEQGKAIIQLAGTVMLGGVCDAPRFEAQIKQTALQFSTVSDVAVFINDTPIEEVLSLK